MEIKTTSVVAMMIIITMTLTAVVPEGGKNEDHHLTVNLSIYGHMYGTYLFHFVRCQQKQA